MPAWKAVFTYVLLLIALPVMRFSIDGTMALQERFRSMDRYYNSRRMLYRLYCARLYKEFP